MAAGAKANLALIDRCNRVRSPREAKYNVLHELHVKQAQFNAALAESLGLSVQACGHLRAGAPVGGRGPASSPRVVIPGQTLYVSVRGADVGGLPVAIQRVWIDTPQGE